VLERARDGAAGLMPRGHWRRAGAAVAAIGIVALAIGVIVGAGAPGSSKGASSTSNGGGVAVVQRRDLVATDTESGTLGYADPQPVFNRISGTLTWLPAVGTTIKPGQALYDVDGSPVILFDGTVPAYRTLASGVSNGPDVTELNANLVKLGFDPNHQITVNDTWQAGTTTAVDAWQASLGQTQTGTITLGEIVFLPGTRRIDSVSGVLGSTGGGGGASAAASTAGASASVSPVATATPASLTLPARPQLEFVSFTTSSAAPGSVTTSAHAAAAPANAAACPDPTATTTTTPTCPTTTTPTTPTPTSTTPTPTPPSGGKGSPTATELLAQLVAELKKLAASGSRSSATTSTGSTGSGSRTSGAATGAGARSSGGGAGGSGGSAAAGASSSSGGGSSSSAGSTGATATQILNTTSADLVVTVQLDATKQSEAVVGEPVTVQLPDGSTVDGKITAVSPVAQSTSSSSSSAAAGGGAASTPSATVPVTIALTGGHHVQGLDQAAVSVNFQQQVERGVLSVPVTALLATPGGGYAVQTVDQAGVHKLVPVTPGLFAGGFVQVSGSNLVDGMQVTDSQG